MKCERCQSGSAVRRFDTRPMYYTSGDFADISAPLPEIILCEACWTGMLERFDRRKPMEIEIKKTERGFAIGEFEDFYGHACSIQQSSIATESCLWLGVDDPDPKILPGDGTGWHPYPLPANVQCTTRMHLSLDQVKALLPHLQRFVETGDL